MPSFSETDKTYGYIVSTGGGAGATNKLWVTPGISANFVGAAFPYGTTEVDQFIGYNIGKEYCSRRVAIELAIEAYLRAKTSAILDKKFDRECIGVAASATCASTRVHKGKNRAHLATVSDKCGLGYFYHELPSEWDPSLTKFGKVGDECRGRDGQFVDSKLLCALISPEQMETVPEDEAQHYILEHPVFKIGQRFIPFEGLNCNSLIWFPGSFNPIHDGHLAMMKSIDTSYWNGRGKYMLELDYSHPTKGDKKTIDILSRIAGIRAATITSKMDIGVFVSKGKPLYLDKVKRNNLAGYSQNYLMGVDTLDRILEDKWNTGTAQELTNEFDTYRARFIVFPRNGITKEDIIKKHSVKCNEYFPYSYAPSHYEPLDISSTKIREERNEST